jgi:hypothetical protein
VPSRGTAAASPEGSAGGCSAPALPRRARALCVAAVAACAVGCIETRLAVELFTQVQGDGSCTRRIEYRLERVDTGKDGARVAIPPEQDPLLTLHRFPTGEPWRMHDEAELGLHVVTVEAAGLASPEAIEGDYLRARSRKALPARNSVSSFCDPERGVYEYQEVLRDPASPLAGMRLLSRLAVKREDVFARQFGEALGERGAAREADLRRAYRELFASPFARDVAQVAERPFFGPRERSQLEEILNRIDARQKDLAARLAGLAGASPADTDAATEAAMQKLGDALLAEIEEAGLPLVTEDSKLRFHATVVMPAPILRANTCANGDTAQWQFDEDDLFGRGFEMKVLATSR